MVVVVAVVVVAVLVVAAVVAVVVRHIDTSHFCQFNPSMLRSGWKGFSKL